MLARLSHATASLAPLALIGASAPPEERVITGDGIIDVRLDGDPVRLRADPAAPGMPLMAQDFAERRGLRMSRRFGVGFVYAIGGAHVTSATAVTQVDLGDGPVKRRVGWTARPFSAVADGSIGPTGLPEPIVHFQLRPALAGEQTISLPMASQGIAATLFGGGWVASFAEIEVGGASMRIRFDPYHARTLATAGAGVRLARAYDGAISGEAVPTEIFFGIERPVRTLTLARQLAIGPLSIRTLGVRTSDFGSTDTIREANAPIVAADPDEITVTAKGRKRDTRRDVISLGADMLNHCSSILFNKPAKRIILTCA